MKFNVRNSVAYGDIELGTATGFSEGVGTSRGERGIAALSLACKTVRF